MRHRLAAARVATLGTVDDEGRPHLVPVCFAGIDDDRLVTAVDHKPKRTTAVGRLAHGRGPPAGSLLAPHYDDDWGALWGVRGGGAATGIDRPTAGMVGPALPKYSAAAAPSPG